MFFDLQRFDGVTNEDKWTVLNELDDTHYTETNASTVNASVFWGFIPAGTTYTEGSTIRGDSNHTTNAYVFAKSDVVLKINSASRINNRIDSTAIINGSIVQHGITGNATSISVELSSGQTVSDLVVEGENKTDLKITIGTTVYNVYFDGSVDTIPPAGLMKKADKLALDNLNTTLVPQLASDVGTLQVQMSGVVVGGEMTANGFVLKNKIGADVATIQSVGLDAETAAATYATKAEMRQYVRQVIASGSGYTFVDGSGTTVAEIPVMS